VRLVPRRPPPEATDADRLRYVRHWAIFGAVLGIPIWVLVFLFVHGEGPVFACAAVTALTVLNIASLTWRIDRAERR
jgi:hypothetical protein